MDRLPSPLLFRLHLVAENGDVHALDAPAGCFPDAVTPDGRYVLCRTNAIVAVPLGDAPLLEVYRPRTGVLGRADVSPDAKWIAYGASESGRREVYVTSLAPGGERRIVSVDGGVQPRWRRDGRELFYIGLDGVLYAVGVTIDATCRPTFSLPTRLFATGLVSPSNLVEQYAPEGDGRRFLFLLPLDQRVRRSVGVLQHWPEIVRQPAASP
jgi:hypothetical protein